MLACLACFVQFRLLSGANERHAVFMTDGQLEQRNVAWRWLAEFLSGQLNLLFKRETVPGATHRQLAVEVEESSVTSFPLEQGQAIPVCQKAQEGSVRL